MWRPWELLASKRRSRWLPSTLRVRLAIQAGRSDLDRPDGDYESAKDTSP